MAKYQDTGNRLSEAAGQMIFNRMVKEGYCSKESIGGQRTFREDITLSNSSGLFATVLAGYIREAVEPVMVGLELLQINDDMMNGQGKGAIKLPKELRATAATVAEGGSISYVSDGYTSITVTPEKRVAASKITWEMLKRGMVSLIVTEARRAGKALARKIDSDIIGALWAVVTNGNSNRVFTGGASTRVAYNNLIDARALLEAQFFKATHLILHPDDYAALCKDTDFKEALFRGTGSISADNSANIFPRVEFFGPQKLIVTPQTGTGESFFVDANEAGTFVKETDIEVVDGRLPGELDSEVIAVQSYGIGIENVNAVAGVEMAAS